MQGSFAQCDESYRSGQSNLSVIRGALQLLTNNEGCRQNMTGNLQCYPKWVVLAAHTSLLRCTYISHQ